ncbi:hypothetical protein JG479_02445 [Pseudoalteromonas sp. LC2018020214]|uniref:thrombospondin type 3 repeat-containing protein n=1 Tax=Pseudoalteromonas sp. LC2018020214 TaxID=2799564 RepID=UPI00190740DC|nr:thrombospondin type 3 repeat-containing protein [Pseudoalteromonas sp. LC2018020214]QQM64753.1 hypothetical protein JG479_02445 [Pseudoalteromonas sp. LC2018020214]
MKIANLAIGAFLIAPISLIASETSPYIDLQQLKNVNDEYKIANYFSENKYISSRSVLAKSLQIMSANSLHVNSNDFTFDSVAKAQFTILENGNEAALPYFSTALYLNDDKTGVAGFDGSSFFYEQNINWAVNNGILNIKAEPRAETFNDFPPFEDIARKYGQEFADHLTTKVDAGELYSPLTYTEQVSFDVNLSKLTADNDHVDIRMHGTNYTELDVPDEWDWLVSSISSSETFDRESKLYEVKSSLLSEQSQVELAGKWLIGLPSNVIDYFSPEGLPGIYSDRLTLNADGSVTDAFSQNEFTWSATSGVFSLVSGDTRFEITPFIEVEKGYLASIKEYKNNVFVRTFNSQMAKFDNSYNQFTDSLITKYPYVWSAGINLYFQEPSSSIVNFDNLFAYKFLSDGTFYRGISQDYENNGMLQFGQKWEYNINDNDVVTSYTTDDYKRERHWEVLSVDGNGTALVFEYSYIGYDNNLDGVVSDDEIQPFIPPRLNSMLKVDLSTYDAWNYLPDSDDDGLKDIKEEELGTDINNSDSDFDGLNDGEEVLNGTNPLDQDSDNDGFTDSFEIEQSSDPLSANSTPGSTSLSFINSEVNNQRVALLSNVKEGWIQKSGLAIDFNSNGQVVLGEQWLSSYSKITTSWQIDDGVITINGGGNTTLSGGYYYYPFNDIEQRFGYDVAQWLREQVDAGALTHDQFLEQNYEVIERKLIKHSQINDELNVISVLKANNSLIIPEAWGYTGSVNINETITEEVVQWDNVLTSTLSSSSSDVQGKWLAFLNYDVTFGAARGLGTQSGIYADTLALQSGGGVSTVNSNKVLNWTFSNGILTLNSDNEEIIVTPFKQQGKTHLAFYQVFDGDQLSEVYIAPLAKFDNSFTQITNNLVTSLPQIQFAGINAHLPEQWDGEQLYIENIFGYQFRNDGTLRRGVSGYRDYNSQSTSFGMGQEWTYTLNGNRIIMNYSNAYSARERIWDVISVDENGRALVYERSRFDLDTNNDGVISDDERGAFIAPRVNTLETLDLSNWESEWDALPDGDGDGLNDYQEDDLGTSKTQSDSDFDGLSDSEEVALGLNPLSMDSDGDGFTDGFEIEQGSDALNAGSTPGSSTLQFDVDDLEGKRVAMTDAAQAGWLAHSGIALKFNDNTTGNIGNGWLDTYKSSSFTWEVINGQINLTNQNITNTYFNNYGYPFDEVRDNFGAEVADWLISKADSNEIPYDMQFEHSDVRVKTVITPYGEGSGLQEVIVSTANQVTLVLPSEWNYEGELPIYEYIDESIRDWEVNPANLFSGFSSSDMLGKWSLFLPLKVTYGPTRGLDTINGIYADMMTLNSNRFAESHHFGVQYQWVVDEEKLVITNSVERIEVMPYKQEGNKLLAFYEVYQAEGLTEVYIAPLAKFDNTYIKLTSNLATQLPQMQLSSINAYMPFNWDNNTLNIEGVFGYHFREDGTLRRGLSGVFNYYNGEGSSSLFMGEEWRYAVDGDRITMSYSDDFAERERIWDVISVDSNGRALVFERSTYDYDVNNDGVISNDERGVFIAPRMNSVELFDLSSYSEWFDLPDSDGDRLNDYQEADLGTDIYNADSDFDGMSDFDEVNNGLSPLDATDATADADNDGLSNLDELLFGTDINNADTDGDGVSDGDEIQLGLNPLDPNDIANAPSDLVKFTDYNGDGVIDWLKHSVVGDAVWLTVLDGRDFSAFSFFNISSELENLSVELLGDRNNDGIKELGLFGFNNAVGRYQLAVYNGYTGQSMGTWNWPETLKDVEFKLLDDLTLDGVQEYAITGIHLTNGTKQLFVKDGVSKQTYKTFKWTNQWLNAQIVQMSDITNDGVPEVALYGRHERLDKGQLFVFDGANSNNKLDVYNWNKLWNNLSLHKMDDLDGDGTTDWGQFGQRKDDGRYQWVVKKGHDKQGVIRTFSWPNDLSDVKPLLLADTTGDNVSEVALYGKNSSGKVFLRVNDGRLANTRIANFSWPATWTEEQVMELGDLNSDGINEVALLGVNINSGKYQLVIKDGRATTEYGRLTLEGNFADLTISSYDANSDGQADVIVNSVNAGTLSRISVIYSGEGLGLLSTTIH